MLLQTCNIETVSSAEPVSGVDPSAEPARGVDPSAEPAPGIDPSAEPAPGVDPSADDGSNKSLDEVNLYDHETSGEIPEKVSLSLFVLMIPSSKKGDGCWIIVFGY